MQRIKEKLDVKSPRFNFSEEDNQAEQIFECSMDRYPEYKKRFQSIMKNKEYFLENIVIGYMFYSNTPFHDPKNGVWKDYTYFIWVYTMIKFVLTVLLEEGSTTEDIIDYCAIMFRKLGHSEGLYQYIIDEFSNNNSNSIAHMSMLLKSC